MVFNNSIPLSLLFKTSLLPAPMLNALLFQYTEKLLLAITFCFSCLLPDIWPLVISFSVTIHETCNLVTVTPCRTANIFLPSETLLRYAIKNDTHRYLTSFLVFTANRSSWYSCRVTTSTFIDREISSILFLLTKSAVIDRAPFNTTVDEEIITYRYSSTPFSLRSLLDRRHYTISVGIPSSICMLFINHCLPLSEIFMRTAQEMYPNNIVAFSVVTIWSENKWRIRKKDSIFPSLFPNNWFLPFWDLVLFCFQIFCSVFEFWSEL